MSDGAEYTTDHLDRYYDHILPRNTEPSKFMQMPYTTFEEFLDKADASYYESDVTGKRRDLRWSDYWHRDHEYGRPYTVVGVDFFARLVKGVVALSHHPWTWDTALFEGWQQRDQEVRVRRMEAIAKQYLKPGTEFAEPVSKDELMERHNEQSDMVKNGLARDVSADRANLHTKWEYRRLEPDDYTE